MPMTARRPSTMNSFLPADISQISMVGQQRVQISELQFGIFPTPSTFSCWKIRFKTQVRSCSSFPSEAMLWITEVEMVDSVNDENHRALFRVTLISRILTLNKIILQQKGSLENRKFRKRTGFLEEDRSLTRSATTSGKLAITIQFLVTLISSQLLCATTMFRTSIRDGTKFYCLSKIPSNGVLENLYRLRIRESAQFKTVLDLYDMEIHQRMSMPDYQKLKTMVKRRIYQKLRLRYFDARNEKIEAGVVVTSQQGVGRGQGVCCQLRGEGQCSRGDL